MGVKPTAMPGSESHCIGGVYRHRPQSAGPGLHPSLPRTSSHQALRHVVPHAARQSNFRAPFDHGSSTGYYHDPAHTAMVSPGGIDVATGMPISDEDSYPVPRNEHQAHAWIHHLNPAASHSSVLANRHHYRVWTGHFDDVDRSCLHHMALPGSMPRLTPDHEPFVLRSDGREFVINAMVHPR